MPIKVKKDGEWVEVGGHTSGGIVNDKIQEGDTKAEVVDTGDGNNGYFTVETNGQEKLRIDSSGRISFGGLDPANYYSTYSQFVMGKTDDSSGMTIVSGTSHAGYITWADGTSSADQYRGRLFYLHSDNSFNFRANGMSHDILKIDSSQLYITSNTADGVLNLDTSGSNGTFIRFKRSGTTKSWIGMSQGLGGYGDNDDLTLLATDNIILAGNSAERMRIIPDKGGIEINKCKFYQWGGSAACSATWSVQFTPINTGGGGNIYHIKAYFSHHSLSYGAYLEGTYGAYSGHTGLQISNVHHSSTSSAGGSWTVSRASTGTNPDVVITHNGGTYNGSGHWFVWVVLGKG